VGIRTENDLALRGGRRPGTRLAYISLACVVLSLGVACGSSDKKTPSASGRSQSPSHPSSSQSSGAEEETSTKTIGGQKINFDKSANVAQQSSIELEADNFYFSPTLLKGKPGQTITLELKNEGDTEHNFTLESQHIDQDLEVGEGAEVKVTFPQSGTLLFHCEYHQALGMQGALQAGS
jgi:plastocyanin